MSFIVNNVAFNHFQIHAAFQADEQISKCYAHSILLALRKNVRNNKTVATMNIGFLSPEGNRVIDLNSHVHRLLSAFGGKIRGNFKFVFIFFCLIDKFLLILSSTYFIYQLL